MKSLFDREKKHLPNKRIPKLDIYCLGYVDNYDVWLVIEEWEFRIYNYEYWSWESISDAWHEDEDWRCGCDKYFEWVWDYMDMATVEYSVAEFTNKDCVDIARELATICEEELEDSRSLVDWAWNPTEGLIDFIRNWLKKIAEYKWNLYYTYYK